VDLAEIAGARSSQQPDRELRLLAGGAADVLRIPRLADLFPDSKFVFCFRDPGEALARMAELWSSGAAVTHPRLEGWDGLPWSLPLIPGWQALNGLPLDDVVAGQWCECTEMGLDALESLPGDRWCVADFRQLRERSEEETQRVCRFLDLGWFAGIATTFRRSLAVEGEIEPVSPPASFADRIDSLSRRAVDYLADTSPSARTIGAAAPEEPLRSVHTGSFPDLVAGTGGSLLVSTYQSGRLILIRREGAGLNTHFRGFDRPMGIACDGDRLVIGTRTEVHEYRNMPEAAAELEPAGTHDACFLPRLSQFTGDVAIHDVGLGKQGEIWLVATKLSCLATLDGVHSLVPRWSPPFISRIAGGDRCHLNGMAMVEGLPRYVTMLGRSDEPGGWREGKATGGLILDVVSGEAIAEGLSMPHSPRWSGDRLYFLESGHGLLCSIDPVTGARETLADLPGFTRGLTIVGRTAFIGLSQIRETATFGGLPIAESKRRLESGVWAVDLDRGEVSGFLRFEGRVQEIFDVALVPDRRFPEIAERDSPAALGSIQLPE